VVALPVPHVAGTVYDAGLTGGGCTVVDVRRDGRRRSEWVGISGTSTNCMGGVTPWNSWLTCEETEAKAGTLSGGQALAKDHGWVFEVFRPDQQRSYPSRSRRGAATPMKPLSSRRTARRCI
jgi:uncharacterized protein